MKTKFKLLITFCLTLILSNCSEDSSEVTEDITNNNENKNSIEINTDFIDFEETFRDQEVSKSFTIINNTTENIEINNISINENSDIFRIKDFQNNIDPNSSQNIEIIFSPKLVDVYKNSISISINDEIFIVNIEGIGVNKILDENDPLFGFNIQRENGEFIVFPSTLKQIIDGKYHIIDVTNLWLFTIEGTENENFKDIEINTDVLTLTNLNSENVVNLALQNINNVKILQIVSTNLINLDGLESVTGDVRISIKNNEKLENIDALTGVTSSNFGNGITINGNDKLKNLDGLINITAAKNVEVFRNDNLNNLCGLQNVISNVTTLIDINNNRYNPNPTEIENGICADTN